MEAARGLSLGTTLDPSKPARCGLAYRHPAVHNARLMSIQKPGEMRCPSCGQSTPIAPFCSHCGATIPSDAPVRPRGMDREELDERIRQSRDQGGPFRRGVPGPDEAPGPFEPEAFVPEPEDRVLRAPEPGAEESRVDRFDDQASTGWGPPLGSEPVLPNGPAAQLPTRPAEPPWPSEPPPPPRPAPPPAPPPPLVNPPPARPALPPAAAAPPAPVSRQAEPRYEAPEYREPEAPVPGYGASATSGEDGGGFDDGAFETGYGYGDEPPRRGGSSALAIVGVLVLAVAALLGGALLYGIITGPSATASASPTPTTSSTPLPVDTGTPVPSVEPSAGASATPGVTETPAATGTPVPDNFTAKVQPCATSDMSFQGCTDDGSTITGTRVWVWVGFYQAQYNDVIGVTLLQGGSSVADGSIQLQQDNIGCKPDKTCTGYLNFNFGALTPGDYTIQVTRNGTQSAETTFTVS